MTTRNFHLVIFRHSSIHWTHNPNSLTPAVSTGLVTVRNSYYERSSTTSCSTVTYRRIFLLWKGRTAGVLRITFFVSSLAVDGSTSTRYGESVKLWVEFFSCVRFLLSCKRGRHSATCMSCSADVTLILNILIPTIGFKK